MQSFKPTTRNDVAVAIGIFVTMLFLSPAIGSLSVRFTYDDWYLMDEGSILYAAFRSSLGALPHIDSVYYYSGGFEILLGLIFKFFGTTFAVARWTLGANLAVTASLGFLICRQLAVDTWVAACFAIATTAVAYVMNYHVYPAWYSITLLLAAVLFLWYGFQMPTQRWWLVLSGVCLGVASSFKQTAGVYGLLAFFLCILILGSTSTTALATRRRSPILLKMELAMLASAPPLILIFFLILIRDQLTLLNAVMFLTAPATIIVYCTRVVTNTWDQPARADQLTRSVRRLFLPILGGAALGFLALVIMYSAHGGVSRFIADSFLNIQHVVATSYSAFKFIDDEAMENPFVFIRWLILFIIPLATALIGFLFSVRSAVFTSTRQLLALISVTIALSYFTLYPIAIRMYVMYLVPLVAVPAAFVAGEVLKKMFSSALPRISIIIVLFGSAFGLYIGNRQLAGDLSKIDSSDIEILDRQTGNVVVPEATIHYLRPILEYMRSRPATESFVAVDVFQKLIAFVTRRGVQTEYSEQHFFSGIAPESYAALKNLVSDRRIATVIIGKRFLAHSGPEQDLLQYLALHYTLAIDNQTHLVYQRNLNQTETQ